MGILDFPNELLFWVAENLSTGDLAKFRSASRELYVALTSRYEKICLEDIGELSALQWAAVRGHVELIELAISNGAEIDKPLRGMLAETAPRISDRSRLICKLANRLERCTETKDSMARTPLHLAACAGQVGAIKALLRLGASMQCSGEIDTPAHLSAYSGDVNCMRAFIDAGFDINTRGWGGRTILHEARCGGVDMIMYLLEQGGGEALVNARDSLQRTPLHWVVGSHDIRERKVMAELLLQHGADIHARDYLEDTPAHHAASMDDVDTMRVLIAAGSDFEAKGHLGRTILHLALYNRTQGMMEYLLGKEGGRGIIHVGDDNGRTPLDHAVRFQARGIMYNWDGYGSTPLNHAVRIPAGENIRLKLLLDAVR